MNNALVCLFNGRRVIYDELPNSIKYYFVQTNVKISNLSLITIKKIIPFDEEVYFLIHAVSMDGTVRMREVRNNIWSWASVEDKENYGFNNAGEDFLPLLQIPQARNRSWRTRARNEPLPEGIVELITLD